MDIMVAFGVCMALLLILLLLGVSLLFCGRVDFHGWRLRDTD